LSATWTVRTDDAERDGVLGLIADERMVYVLVQRGDVSHRDVARASYVMALRSSDGHETWRYDANDFTGVKAMVRQGDRLVAAGINGLFWIDCATGDLIRRLEKNWATPGFEQRFRDDPHRPVHLIAQGERVIVNLRRGDLVCVDGLTGREKWQACLDVELLQVQARGDRLLLGTPGEAPEIIVVGSEDGRIFPGLRCRLPDLRRRGVRVPTGILLPKPYDEGGIVDVTIDRESILCPEYGLSCVAGGVDLLTGRARWKVTIPGTVAELWSTRGRILASCIPGGIICIDGDDGRILWRVKPPQRQSADGYSVFAPVRAHEKYLWLLGWDGDILCIDIETGAGIEHLLPEIPIRVAANTAVSGRWLIIGDASRIDALPVFMPDGNGCQRAGKPSQ